MVYNMRSIWLWTLTMTWSYLLLIWYVLLLFLQSVLLLRLELIICTHCCLQRSKSTRTSLHWFPKTIIWKDSCCSCCTYRTYISGYLIILLQSSRRRLIKSRWYTISCNLSMIRASLVCIFRNALTVFIVIYIHI